MCGLRLSWNPFLLPQTSIILDNASPQPLSLAVGNTFLGLLFRDTISGGNLSGAIRLRPGPGRSP